MVIAGSHVAAQAGREGTEESRRRHHQESESC